MLYSEDYKIGTVVREANLQYLEQLDLREERVKRLISAPDISKRYPSLNSFNSKKKIYSHCLKVIKVRYYPIMNKLK